ncbi:DUF6286 domain-containing protein [Streptomyces gulbargensis]|uniref:DUF6286 domain-containing protein n=1 Tax=Streptomyces gulbargensis TaxID=364901 RepID=A0ABP7LXY5_9ACTN
MTGTSPPGRGSGGEAEREPRAATTSGTGTGTTGSSPVPSAVPVLTDGAPPPPARRFWSVRRVPAALLAAVILGCAGLLLYDVAAVRADRSAMAWRRDLADDLATRPLDNAWVLAGAALAVLLGLWLLVLALTPGLRAVLPMRGAHSDLRAGLDREAAALTLRDRAMEVSGVQSVRVAVGRTKVGARAVSHFRDLDEVRADVERALETGIDALGLAHRPTLSVRVARPPRKG